jgi:hypothetical protein
MVTSVGRIEASLSNAITDSDSCRSRSTNEEKLCDESCEAQSYLRAYKIIHVCVLERACHVDLIRHRQPSHFLGANSKRNLSKGPSAGRP